MSRYRPILTVWRTKPLFIVAILWMLIIGGMLFLWSYDVGERPLVIVWNEDPLVYDPHRTSHPVSQSIFRHVCEPLFYKGFDGNIYGLLAEGTFEYSADGRTLVVPIRKGITFHDSTPLDAVAVQKSFERIQYYGVSPLANTLRAVRFEADTDNHAVIFRLPEANYEFVSLVLSSSYAVIVSPLTEDPTTFVDCTGPYQFVPEMYQVNQHLTLVRSFSYKWPPGYFDNREHAYIPQIQFRFEPQREERLTTLLEGQSCVLSLSQEHIDVVKQYPHFRLYDDYGGVTYLGFNFQKPRWQDLSTRQALVMAIDEYAVAQQGPFLIADTPLIPGAIGYTPSVGDHSYSFSPESSQTLLDQVGFDREATLTLVMPESNTYQQLGEVIQQQLQAIGLKNITIRSVPRSNILAERQDFDLLLFDYAWEDYTAFAAFLGPGPRNLLNYPHNNVATLTSQAASTSDAASRQDLISEAQKTILEEAIWHPLVIREITTAVNSRCVQGEFVSPDRELLWHDAKTLSGP